jgi:serine protease
MLSIRTPGAGASRVSATIATLLAAAMFLFAGTALAQGPDPDRFIVKFAEGKSQQGQAVLLGASAELLLELGPQNAVAARIPAQALAGLQNNPNIEYIERDPPRYPMAETVPYGVPMVQADPYGTDLKRLGPGAHAPKVCIIDSGYDYAHEDLPKHEGITGLDSTNWKTDGCAHGTHVAGTIAAVGNSLGVVGILGKGPVNIYNVKVFGDTCSWSYASNLIDASNKCAGATANIINMSLGCSGNRCASSTEDNAFATHYKNGILSIAAAGNAGNTAKSYPASYASVISVAAVDSAGVVASFSQKNDAVELAAPGVAVRSTVPMKSGKEESLSVASVGYEAIALEGSPNKTGSGALFDCGLGTATCTGASGKVCLIQRGENSFANKVLNCQGGGGTAAVIYNNAAGLFSGTLGSTTTTIPSVAISQADGVVLKGKAGATSTVVVGIGNYAYYDGTSMATPHVAGVAALIWTHNKDWTNAQIRKALQDTARHPTLASGAKDNSYGYGLVQAKAAYDLLTKAGTPPPANNSPVASFTFGCTDRTCAFTDTSTDSDGTIESWAWSFGEGTASSTARNPTHTYAAGGTYTVTLTVTDNGGATGTTSQSVEVSAPAAGGITLTATGSKVKGVQTVKLDWKGATSGSVDIIRNDAKIATVGLNTGSYTDSIGKGSGTYKYKVCETGSTTACSNEVTVIL